MNNAKARRKTEWTQPKNSQRSTSSSAGLQLKIQGGYEAEQIGESQIMKNSIHHIMDFTLYLGGVS